MPLLKGHLYSLAGTLFLGQAQNIFMPATTINTYFNYWSRGKQLILFPEVEPDRDYCFFSVLRPCLSQLAASSSPLAYMVYAWSLLRFTKENERLPSAYSLNSWAKIFKNGCKKWDLSKVENNRRHRLLQVFYNFLFYFLTNLGWYARKNYQNCWNERLINYVLPIAGVLYL